MASKTTLNAKNLEALGTERLAALLIEVSAGDAALKRRLRLELASAESPDEVAKAVRKRLSTIGRARTFVDWQNRRSLVDDLETQRRAIVEQIAPAEGAEALDLMWQFLALAKSVFGRCDDSNGTVMSVFHVACTNLGEIAVGAKADPRSLADQTFEALNSNDFGQYDDLIRVLTPALGQHGLEHLKQRMIALSKEPVQQPPEGQRRTIGYGPHGPIFADELAERARISTIRAALMTIADVQGDVDAFIAQYDEDTRKAPRIAAEIARRLLAADRVDEAWQAVEAGEPTRRRREWPDFEWEDARIEVLEALGRTEDAQAARWACFERSLSASHLRAYLKRLPDFDDVEAEQRALDYVGRFGSPLHALSFLVSWPALDRAAALIIQQAKELNGDHFEILTPAAEALAGKYPLAATLALRAMIDFSLKNARSGRYRHVARHFMECASLASTIGDFGSFETHEAYAARLRAEHGRKSTFWSLVA